MIDGNQTNVVHDWVVLSLSNFTQRTPLAMAVWSLTCFFISASVNQWLRALYPLSCLSFHTLIAQYNNAICVVRRSEMNKHSVVEMLQYTMVEQ